MTTQPPGPEPRYDDGIVAVHVGDCLDVLPGIDDCSVDAVVTDPPYGLGFMGKDWDSPGGTGDFPMRRFDAINTVNTGASRQGGRQRSTEDFAKRQARDARAYREWCELWATECLRVLKPGGYLLAFGGTRTYHRLASAIEDAGFEIRDSITWMYGNGFPKSLDVSKAIDKLAGHWRGRAGEVTSANGSMENPNRERTDKGEPVTAAAAAAGWGTALKPASEPIVVARKSTSGTVAANWLEHRTGALNIDGCRVDSSDATEGRRRHGGGSSSVYAQDEWSKQHHGDKGEPYPAGRWPPNVLLDEIAAAALDVQTGVLTSGATGSRRSPDKSRGTFGAFQGQEECEPARGATEGGASRFFPVFRYEAKAPDEERPRVGSIVHPTVKPVDLMRWLVRLVTPTGGVVLDPFLGSGSTAEACVREGLRCVGIEREEDYMTLIEARLSKPTQIGFSLGGIA